MFRRTFFALALAAALTVPAIGQTPTARGPLTTPATGAAAVVQSDSVNITTTKAIWVGAAGTLKVTMLNGTAVTFTGINAGTLMPLQVTRIWDTGTSIADANLIALY
jgi:hypothetical protein